MAVFRVNDVKVEDNVVRNWIWRRRIPQYKTTVVAGDWGSGKTTAVCSIISHIFNKEEFPDGEIPECEPGHVFFITTESDTEEIGQKLVAQGMDREDVEKYIHVLDYLDIGGGELRTFDIDGDQSLLEARLKQYKPLLVIFDPLVEFHSRKEIDAKAIRGLMVKLQQVCDKWKTTLLCLMHWNKNEKLSRANRASGSTQYQAAVKSVITVWKNPKNKDQRFFSQEKHNLSSEPPEIAFHIEEPGVLIWGKTEGQKPSTKLAEAEKWLMAHCVEPKTIQQCITESGLPERTLKRARSNLSIALLTREIYTDGRMVAHWEVASDKNLWGLIKLSVDEPGN